MTLYHGSDSIIEKPYILSKYRALDFGGGFYATTNFEQAADFCQRVLDRNKRLNPEHQGKKFVSIYEINEAVFAEGLNVKKFESANEEWFDFVRDNRQNKYIGEKFDIIIGAVANDTIYRVFELFEDGIIDRQMAIQQLKIRELYNQFVFTTESSLENLTYKGFKEVL